MPRRAYKIHKQRKLSVNTKGESSLIQKFINQIVKDGKTRLAQTILYSAIENIEKNADATPKLQKDSSANASQAGTQINSSVAQTSASVEPKNTTDTMVHSEGIQVLRQAVLNVTPLVEVKPRRIGGSVFQVPIEVHSERGTVLAVRWIVQSARQRAGRGMANKIASELIDASQNTGSAMKKREDVHRMAEANKAFAHYR
jgi:small subunit ribosomal protein S7